MTTRIVFLDRDTLPSATVFRAPNFPHKLVTYDRTESSQTAERIGDAEIAIANKVRIGADVIAACPNTHLP